uniref:Granulins domain-containing protein n=1 Tax=Mola mola TaxID=94237 RepID=A0A3Q3X6B8_MOLML
MLRLPLCLLVGVCVWGFVSCSITCPDGNVCSDFATCCITLHGYSCCPYPKAVCCSDLAHCCPSGFVCNLDTQQCERPSQPWLNIPMVKKEKAEELIAPVQPVSSPQELKKSYVPDKQKSSVVFCDNYYTCPDGNTCCRHRQGGWFCCPFSVGQCCSDGQHCCEYGYTCTTTSLSCHKPFSQVPSATQERAKSD